MRKIIVCAVCALSAAAAAAPVNLLKNGGFEAVGADGVPVSWSREWNPVLTGPFGVSADARGGTKAVRLMTEEWTLDRPQFVVQDAVIPRGAQAVRLAAWCKGQGLVQLSIRFTKGGAPLAPVVRKEYFGEYPGAEETARTFGLHREYAEYAVEAAVPAGADGVRIRLGNTVGALNLVNVWGTAWIDDVSLETLGAPAAPVPTVRAPAGGKTAPVEIPGTFHEVDTRIQYALSRAAPPAAGMRDVAPYARISTDPPSLNTGRLVDGKEGIPGTQFVDRFELAGGSERYPSFTFAFPKPVPMARLSVHLLGNVERLRVRADADGSGRFGRLLADVRAEGSEPRWLALELGGEPLAAVRVEGIEGAMRGYRASLPFLDEAKILVREEAARPLLADLQRQAVFHGRRYPGGGVPAAAFERIPAPPLPASGDGRFARMLTVDLWMFGINLKKDTKIVDYRKTESFRRVVQACRLAGFDSIMIFMENWSSPVVPWPSRVCNSTDENILKALIDALHAEGLKVHVMPSSATSPPFPGKSIFIYPKEETSRYPQMEQFPSIVHGTHYRDGWLTMLDEIMACGADGVSLCPDENYYKGHFLETMPKDDPGRALYRKRFGAEVPAREEDTLAYRRWVALRHEGICDLYGYWSRALSAKYPGVYLGSRFMQPYAGCSNITEVGIPFDLLGARGGIHDISSDYCGPYGIQMMAAANGWRRAAMCYDASIWGPLQGAPRKSDIEIAGETLWSVMYGLGMIDIYRENYLYEQGTLPAFMRAFTMLGDLEKLGVHRARPPKTVAFLSSRASMDWWQVRAWWGANPEGWDRGVEGVRGWYADRAVHSMLQRQGLTFDWLFLDRPDQCASLSGYKLLVVPFAYSVSREAAERIAAAAKAGARVILFDGKAGPTDEWGEPYARPVLQDLVDSGAAVLFTEDIFEVGGTDSFAGTVAGTVKKLLGDALPVRFDSFGRRVDAGVLEKGPDERFLFLVNWEKAEMSPVDLGLSLPEGRYEVLARDADFWYRVSVDGRSEPTREDLARFRVSMVPETVCVLHIRRRQ